MVVGDDEARRIDDDAGAERALHLLARHAAAAAEEPAEERIVRTADCGSATMRARVDVDHRRRHPLDHRRVGQLHLRRRSRDLRWSSARALASETARAKRAIEAANGRRASGIEKPRINALHIGAHAGLYGRRPRPLKPLEAAVQDHANVTRVPVFVSYAAAGQLPRRRLAPDRNPCPWRRRRDRRTRSPPSAALSPWRKPAFSTRV